MTEQDPWAPIVGPCFTASSFARELGWSEDEVRDAAAALFVLELETADRVLLYPAFQLKDGVVVNGLSDVLRALSQGTRSRWTWSQWLNTPIDDTTGETAPSAIDQLRAGQRDQVLLDARHTAATWSS